MGIALLGAIPILLLAVGGTARSQDLFPWEFAGGAPGDGFGGAVASAGDVDADGTPDILVGAPQGPTAPGYARVYSGASGTLLLVLAGTAAGDRFGSSVSSAGDVDGDGSDDVIVGAPGLTGPGYARVASGATGATLLAIPASPLFGSFGFAVAGAGDVDGDGTPDVAVGAPGYTGSTGCNSTGAVRVYSGASGASAFPSLFALMWGDGFGYSIAAVGDLDGDAVSDFMVGAPQTLGPNPGCNGLSIGAAIVFSGASGSPLFSLSPPSINADYCLGGSVGLAGDVNADGTPDVFAASGPFGQLVPVSPVVRVFSGIDGSPLSTISIGTLWNGLSVAGLGDVDGNGVPDLAIAEQWGCSMGPCSPFTCCGPSQSRVEVRDGASGNLISRLDRVSSSAFALAPGGDLDGDGKTDLLIGAQGDASCFTNPVPAGRATAMSMLAPGASIFGVGCVPYGYTCLPLIGTTGGPPATGNPTFGIRVSNVPGGAALVLAAGAALPPGIPLPYPGCALWVSPDVLVPAIASGTAPPTLGSATVGIPIPASPALVGQSASFQWYAVNPAVPTLGALSQALELVVL